MLEEVSFKGNQVIEGDVRKEVVGDVDRDSDGQSIAGFWQNGTCEKSSRAQILESSYLCQRGRAIDKGER